MRQLTVLPSAFRSVRAKLLLLSLGLIAVPGAVFALLAATSATRALERAVGRQFATVSSDAAHELASLFDAQRVRLKGWASQELMREVIVADVDKRISRFLLGERARDEMLLDMIVTDGSGTAVAATDPALIGTLQRRDALWMAAGSEGVEMAGPRRSARYQRPVLEFAAVIRDPEEVSSQIGMLYAVYDWRVTEKALTAIREELATVEIDVELLILDADGRIIGGSWTRREGLALGEDLHAAGWHSAAPDGPRYAVERRVEALVGRETLMPPAPRWTVLAVQPRGAALAPVRTMSRRLIGTLALVVLAGLAVAALLAHRMVWPLRSLTRATGELVRADGALQAIPVTTRDEIGELTAAFNRMAADLSRTRDDLVAAARLASVGEIAAGIAHEVRTPLGILRGSAQMLGRSLRGDDEQQRELVGMIVGEVDRVERVVTGLTELGKPRQLSIEVTALEPLLERAAALVAGQARTSRVAVRLERATEPCVARCDPEQIYQVVLNLLMNALQVQPHGSEIRLQTRPARNERVAFEVSDDGPGIPEDVQPHIFTPFYTRREGGTGLGLALVERVVRAHTGTVAVTSAPGHGTTFRVDLPAGTPS